jgi:hypothetical protein
VDQIRSAPPWLIILLAVLVAIILIGSLPFAGWMIERKRRVEASQVARAASGGMSFFSGLPDRPQRFGALDVTFAGQTDTSPTTIVSYVVDPPAMPEAPADPDEDWLPDVPDIEDPVNDDQPEPAPEDSRVTFMDRTQEWNIVEVFEGEVEPPKSPELMSFEADPLGAWQVPPETGVDDEETVRFERTFRAMVALNRLTGIGADVETEWQAWYAEEMETAR